MEIKVRVSLGEIQHSAYVADWGCGHDAPASRKVSRAGGNAALVDGMCMWEVGMSGCGEGIGSCRGNIGREGHSSWGIQAFKLILPRWRQQVGERGLDPSGAFRRWVCQALHCGRSRWAPNHWQSCGSCPCCSWPGANAQRSRRCCDAAWTWRRRCGCHRAPCSQSCAAGRVPCPHGCHPECDPHSPRES